MTYREEETVGLRHQRSKQAITLAMEGRWREAIAVNQSLIESFPDDVSAYNRLGRAYLEMGELSYAREAYHRTIELDPCNDIAQKNLSRLSHLKEKGVSASDGSPVEPQHFIEETGKAGVVSLHHLGQPEVTAKLVAGDQVYLKIDGSNLVVADGRGEYLGQVDPKHGRRLIKLIEGGNKYTAAIVSSAEDMATIIIREVYQDPTQGLGYEEAVEEEEETGYATVGGEETEIPSEELADFNNRTNDAE